MLWGCWRDASVAKSSSWSSRGLGLGSQDSNGSSQLPITAVAEASEPYSGLHGPQLASDAYTIMHNHTHIYIKFILKNECVASEVALLVQALVRQGGRREWTPKSCPLSTVTHTRKNGCQTLSGVKCLFILWRCPMVFPF